MSDKAFVDTNVLVYLFDADEPQKQTRAQSLLETEGVTGDLVLSTQVLQELYVTVTRKLAEPLPPERAFGVIRGFTTAMSVLGIDAQMVLDAIALSRQHVISLWDALIVQAALSAGCKRLLTEDLQDGWVVKGLRVENPFRPAPPDGSD